MPSNWTFARGRRGAADTGPAATRSASPDTSPSRIAVLPPTAPSPLLAAALRLLQARLDVDVRRVRGAPVQDPLGRSLIDRDRRHVDLRDGLTGLELERGVDDGLPEGLAGEQDREAELALQDASQRLAGPVVTGDLDLSELALLLHGLDDAHGDVVVEAVHALDVRVRGQHLLADGVAGVAVVAPWRLGHELAVRAVGRERFLEPLGDCGGGLVAGRAGQEADVALVVEGLVFSLGRAGEDADGLDAGIIGLLDAGGRRRGVEGVVGQDVGMRVHDPLAGLQPLRDRKSTRLN